VSLGPDFRLGSIVWSAAWHKSRRRPTSLVHPGQLGAKRPGSRGYMQLKSRG